VIGLDRVEPTTPGVPYTPLQIDLRDEGEVAHLAERYRGLPVIHLAASAVVEVHTSQATEMVASNVQATINILTHIQPRFVVFASSGAVYGDCQNCCIPPNNAPRGLYGCTKDMCEKVLDLWADDTGAHAISLRFGNVVGAGCRGLIPLLVNQATGRRAGEIALRGGGEVYRDYVPVDYVVDHILEAATKLSKSRRDGGGHLIFNIGSDGRGYFSNRQIALFVADSLHKRGRGAPQVRTTPNLVLGEVMHTLLDTKGTSGFFSVKPLESRDILDAVEAAVESYLETG
jgi:nucleoside-diphosphate-sugar epimerase